MVPLTDVPWPPAPLVTERLRLRATCAADRPGYIELFTDADVRRYLGGPADRDELERAMPPVPGDRPGVFAVESAGAFVGTVTLERRDAELPGLARPTIGALEVGYQLLPSAWGQGVATEAVTAVLAWADRHLPGEPILLCTQVANEASRRLASRLGFREAARVEQYGAEQWLGVRDPPAS